MLMDQPEKLLSYNGELLIFQLSKEKSSESRNTKLCVRRMIFRSDTKLFVEKNIGSFSMCGEGVEIIHCSCVSDFRTGIILPCILMKKIKKKNIKYILLLLHNFNKFEFVLNFKLDYELKEPIKLLDGPTVLWGCAKKIFYISAQTCTVLCAPIEFSSIKWVGQVRSEGIVVLGTRAPYLSEADDGKSVAESEAVIWGSECLAYAVEKQKVLTGASFLPHAYSSMVSCVHICRAEAVRNTLRTSAVAVTCKSQLIVFQDGLPKDVYKLPYDKPCSIQIAIVEGGQELVVVSFSSGEVCSVWKDSLQVAACWQNVSSVLTDDFVGVGTDQVLAFPKTESISEKLTTFQITDFGKYNYVSNISCHDLFSTKEVEENRFFTIKALEARLQVGFTSVHELQRHLKLKEKVLMKSCAALINLVQGQKQSFPSSEKEGLVSLWDETPKPFDNGISTPPKDPEQFVEEVWYHVVDDCLVVGVKLMESFDSQLCDVTLSLVMDHKYPSFFPTKCRCSVFMLKKVLLAESASHWQPQPVPKRIKLNYYSGKGGYGEPSQIKAVGTKVFTAVTALSPFLAFHQVWCRVLLHAKEKNCKDENFQKNKARTLLCGRIFLSMEAISTGKHSVNLKNFRYAGSVKDIVALCAASHKLSFQIISPDCMLTRVNTWLLEQMECTPVEEYPDFKFCCKYGNLNGTLFNWNLETPFEGTLTVFCRHQTALFQCLHSLFGLLPSACKIKPLRLRSKKVLVEQLALALEKEMVSLQLSLSSALCKTENNLPLDDEESKETDSVPAVQQFREAFKKEQKQSVVDTNRTVDGTIYRRLILNVAEAQLNSDPIAWQCSSF
ncbi:Fanconi anemia group B protein [Heteronotia binoei]|uniref:Fanconi anemia group B protein n=1 Tax=Heteronotia binoei TaxID=13085 RepID=UPI00293016E8|nr:Fanconi anemia group B protein [Heteronotia binoei]XP_060089979.1 Fanconi anemia group B protein [Heteronotia binoei]XP_060089980.1 Fanconi anemia group B protein [Heteronotia binoei]